MNQALIESLFGATTPIDIIFLDGSVEDTSASAIKAKLAAIPEGTSPNFYLHSVNEAYFNADLMNYFSNAKFTKLGLESITKGALVKILKSLPLTVTTIGFANLNEIQLDHLQGFLNRTKKTRNIEVIVGDNVYLQSSDKEHLRKKRKLNSTHVVVAAKLARQNEHKSDSSRAVLSEPAENIVKSLQVERDQYLNIINRDPDGQYILSLQARLRETEANVEIMGRTITTLKGQLQEANQRNETLQDSKVETGVSHLPALSLSSVTSPVNLPASADQAFAFMLYNQPTDLLSAPPPSHGLLQNDSLFAPLRHSPYGSSHSIFSSPRFSVPTSLPLLSPSQLVSPSQTQHRQLEHYSSEQHDVGLSFLR
jgi:hypothetical protein